MESKYLSDGRKVVVIGQLNNVESIVQEVFVSESGDQIPSGEKFTTKSLHDEPVKPWKQKEAEKAEAQYNKMRLEIKDIKKELLVMKGKRQGHVDILKQNEKLISLFDGFNVNDLTDILMGNVKYVIASNSYSFKVQEFEDGLFSWSDSYGDKTYEGLCMMRLYALKSSPYQRERRCKVSISNYTDGSGSERGYEFFKSDKELNKFLTDKVESKYKEEKLTLELIKEVSKYITVPDIYMKETREKEVNQIKERYANMVKNNEDNMNKELKRLENKGG
tara:strand:- start:155 stop:985 length:831 start_codon:yes stop_codon:yes gene_type:complete